VLVAGSNIELLNSQIKTHNPKIVVIANAADKDRVDHARVYSGEEAILRAIEESSSSLVLNALVGFLGLRPTLKAIECGKRVALANKESLVAAGAFIDISKIQPIDSEHFGLWYLMQGQKSASVEQMIITASGGAFRDWAIADLSCASLQDTQKHPNWSMGRKITIDSATMVNKMFELLEAKWLFGVGEGSHIAFDAIIETRSLIHGLLEFRDGSTTAHFAKANMQLPIAYALGVPQSEKILSKVDLVGVGALEFRSIEQDRYPVWEIKNELLQNPVLGVVINAANEVAIEHFIANKIGFMDISRRIITAFEKFRDVPKSVDEVFEVDSEVRKFVGSLV
jgi:1-deoxy-D-xylulose-5-phosphate reductoisomerase